MNFIMIDFQHVGNGAFGSFGLAALMRSLGHRASVIGATSVADLINEKDRFVNVLKSESPDLIGFSVFTPYADYVDTLAIIIKEALGDVPIVLGGYHSTMFGKKVFDHFQHIDYAAVGDAEQSLPRLLESIRVGSSEPIVGIYRKPNLENKQVSPDFAQKAVLPTDHLIKTSPILDDIPYPFEDVLHPEYYEPKIISGSTPLPRPSRYVLFSRGCPFTCSFCKIDRDGGFRTKMKYYTPKKIIEILGTYRDDYGIRGISFIDDNFTLNKKWAYAICEGIKKNNLKMDWHAQIRADLMDVDLLKAMRDAGCTIATITIEAGNDRIRSEVLDKRVSRQELRDAYYHARKAGMLIQGTLMMGSPTETVEEMEDSVALLNELDPDWAGIVLTTLIPGTPLWNRYEKQIKANSWSDYEIANQPTLYENNAYSDLHHIPKDLLMKRFLETRDRYLYSNRLKLGKHHFRSVEHLKWYARENFTSHSQNAFDKHNLKPVHEIAQ